MAESGGDDCSVVPAGGVAGDNITVNVNCEPNDTGANRVINITISTGNAQLVVPVTQKPTPTAIFTAFEYPGAETTYVQALNNSGQVIGGSRDSSNAFYQAFLYDSKTGNYTAIDPPGSTNSPFVSYINDSGQVVGYSSFSNAGTRQFLYDSNTGNYTVIDTPDSTPSSAREINESGQVIGYLLDSESYYVKSDYLYDGDRLIEIAYPGATRAAAISINNSGQIIVSISGESYFLLEFEGL